MYKRFISLMSVLAILIGGFALPTVQTGVRAEHVETVYYDDFESGIYTVVDGINGTNKTKTMYKDGTAQWIFERNGGGELTDFPQTLVSNISAADSGLPVNTTTALNTTGSYKLGKNTVAYLNLPRTYTKGTVTIDLRFKRPAASDTTSLNLYAAPFSGYNNTSDKVAQLDLFSNSSSRGRFRYPYEYRSETTRGTDTDVGINDDSGTKIQGWPYIKMVVNIDTQKVTLYYRLTNTGAMKEWTTVNFYANGNGTYHMANALSAISFDGAGMLGIDDVSVTYENSNTAPIASNVRITGATTIGTALRGEYDYSDAENHVESGSVSTWKRCPDDEFTTNVQVIKTEPASASETSEYILTPADLGYYIQYSVVPKNQAEDNNIGLENECRTKTPVRYVKTQPTVSILHPENGTQSYYGKPVTIAVDAFCDNASITKIEYFANGVKIGEDSEQPYELDWTPSDVGTYLITAKGYNDLTPQETGESQPVVLNTSPVSHAKVCGDDRITTIGRTITDHSKLYGSAVLNNTSADTSLNVFVGIAFYDAKGKLLKIGSNGTVIDPSSIGVQIGAAAELTPEIKANTTLIKLFVWDSISQKSHSKSHEYAIIPDSSGMYDMDLYLLLGQSNMSGRAYIPSDCKPVIDRAYLFNNNYEWVGANNPFNRFNNISEPSYKYSNSMNLGYPFAKMLTEHLPNRKIGIFNNAYGGTNLTQWEKGNATGYYENTMIKAKEMQKYGRIKGILWHLGSSDMGRGYTRDEYIQKLGRFAASLREDLGDDTIPFVIGELAPTSEQRIAFNNIFMTIDQGAINVPHSACVSAEGTTTSDGSHFDSASTKLFGRRYAAVILKMSYGITAEVD